MVRAEYDTGIRWRKLALDRVVELNDIMKGPVECGAFGVKPGKFLHLGRWEATVSISRQCAIAPTIPTRVAIHEMSCDLCEAISEDRVKVDILIQVTVHGLG
jgi:hypothetical protein